MKDRLPDRRHRGSYAGKLVQMDPPLTWAHTLNHRSAIPGLLLNRPEDSETVGTFDNILHATCSGGPDCLRTSSPNANPLPLCKAAYISACWASYLPAAREPGSS